MNVSKQLKVYIDFSFEKMLLQSEQLNQARADYQNSPEENRRHADRERHRRAKNTRLKKLDSLHQYLRSDCYQEAKKEIIDEYVQSNKNLISKEGDVTQNPLKGKATTDFNNFLYRGFYLIKKEIPKKQDKLIYKMLADFLSEKGHTMPNGDPFDYTDISSRIAFFKKLSDDIKQHFYIILDSSYEDFCKRRDTP